jgi:uncharacterized protein (DUF1501 family)
MKRRNFLHTAAAGLLLPLGTHAWAYRNAEADTEARKLIVIMLRGAVDGLSVVAPYADANYAQQRPQIALAKPGTENGVFDLDGYFGLHPALSDLQELWRAKKLGFVQASGSPDTTRSHFDAQDYLESGTPGKKNTADGWMNRALAALPGAGSPTRAISIGSVMPRILSGNAAVTNLAQGAAGTKANALDKPAVGSAFAQLYAGNAKYAEAFAESKATHQEMMSAAMSDPQADGGAPLPNGFPDDAARLARLMRNDPKIQFAFMALGGWDTHANQGAATGQLANRLRPLGQGLATLCQRLDTLFDDTCIVVMSEFGRTFRQNGNGGTDHGHGNVMWLLGGQVAGGKVHGNWPGVGTTQLYEGRDLAVTTDFRQVLSQVCTHHLALADTQLEKIFPAMPASTQSLKLFAA